MKIIIPSEALSDIELQNLRDTLQEAMLEYPSHALSCAIEAASIELRERARAIGTREAILILSQ